jgi:hypothetical protein
VTQLFSRVADPLLRAGLLAGGSLAIFTPLALLASARSPYATQEDDPIEQPVDFDHRHHVEDAGIACVACHAGALTDAFAGVPSADVCMRCHTQVWSRAERLAPVRRSALTGTPIVWKRVTNLPQHVFFHHGIHAARGVRCEACHGRVDSMGAVYAVQPMTMGFCLDCHEGRASRDCSACHR